ncbi:DUF2512 family protein [Bacillus massiliglaciei]|uniref:DUF2512 family protein n=1 Tax=Bacillus massiliglaciei TaxID=1816693 RepID=UPI000DA62935|nr:DUF2512 family protein [Bacillus massiliglaciei]
MNHGLNLLVKAAIVLPVMFIMLWLFFNVSLTSFLLLSLILLVLAYTAGDLYLFPRAGNVIGTIGDFFLALAVLWIGLGLVGYEHPYIAALVTAAVLAVGEWFYHMWLEEHALKVKADEDYIE